MTVKDYALDVNLSVAEVLKECSALDIKAKGADDVLSEDDIIMLDNTINLISTEDEITFEEDEEIEDAVDELISASNVVSTIKNTKKEKISKKKEFNSAQFNKDKKEMYKNKSKLQNNGKSTNIIIYKEGMSLYTLAEAMQVNPAELIKKLISLEIMIGINDVVDYETAEMLTSEYKRVLKTEETQDVSNFEEFEIIDNEADLIKRPPVVTIMGHVDHGKTSLLDYIRKSRITQKEAGGITQAIGAYKIKHEDSEITFIDTPGHAAFTEMRARGASITDIVIIIVAADDGVMPQTKEAVEHALAANVPLIVAINKIDKEGANPERVKTELAELNITPEEWGGDYPFIPVSAVTGEGIDNLLETISVISEVNEYKANPNRYAVGAVIESRIDKRVGGVASFMIQNGTLRIGDPIVVGLGYAKIRSMKNDLGEPILEAGPSTPVEVTGITTTPDAGDMFMAFETEAEAKKVATKRLEASDSDVAKKKPMTLDDLFGSAEEKKEIVIILKTDVKGSEEAIKNSLLKLENEEVSVKIIRSGIGSISDTDINLAKASGALIIGFNVKENTGVKDFAKANNVEIRIYDIIYKLLEDVERAISGMIDPVFEEKALGKIEIRKIFTFSKVGNIAGSYVTDGIIKKGAKARLLRKDEVISDTSIATLQREKDQVTSVKKGFECGITLSDFDDIKEGDVVEVYEIVEVTI